VSVEGPVVVTRVQQVDGGLEVRLFNPEEETQRAEMRLHQELVGSDFPTQVQLVDFESQSLGPAAAWQGVFEIDIAAKKIITLRLT
jgi:hypothetical protein